MADELDALLERVDDDDLRAELWDQIERLRRQRQFGLVFESHLPERIRLPDHSIRRGAAVVKRDAPPDEMPQEVLQVRRGSAVLEADGKRYEVDLDDLVVVAEFGDPIYPGMRRLGTISRGGDRPAHVVIKGENYHALESLRFSHAGKVDCIYIDPPYNTGARDWKYDNDYVDGEDTYRHSKWLAFMERRLRLAKDLLNPDDSVLIVTVDEKEYARLGILLEQLFPNAKVQMVSTVISPSGAARNVEFTRVNEFIYFVMIGTAAPEKTTDDMLFTDSRTESENRSPIWNSLLRLGAGPARADSPSKFYPVLINESSGAVLGAGEALLGVLSFVVCGSQVGMSVGPAVGRSSFVCTLERSSSRWSASSSRSSANRPA